MATLPSSEIDVSRKNLTALLGIAFFGVSITWSTIFSGTRGNLVLISWAACFFIVAAVGAAGASILGMQDENIVAMYPPVRWTVRILSLLAMVHVPAGMFLVAIAILVLDPGKVDIESAAADEQEALLPKPGRFTVVDKLGSFIKLDRKALPHPTYTTPELSRMRGLFGTRSQWYG
ncbi:hypothetical protein B0H13DRAFT_1935689 [Mycena leptocephala]|nr:hypothetical protein B0H13DRAFT_1935689 [Mycena leptocephala]